MAKDKLVDYDSTASGNLDVGGISVAEGMLPSNVNNAIREQMSHLKDFADGTEAINALAVDNLKMDGNTISSTDTNGDITLDPNGTGDIVLDANVGIGTSSPKRNVHLHNTASTTTKIQITNGATGSSTDGDGFQIGIGNDGTANIEQRENVPMTFSTNNTERLRIDSSGNLLVGTTNANPAENNVAGIGALANNTLSITRDGNAPMQLNRKTSDGSIAIFRKDGSTVGSIGTNGGRPYFVNSTYGGLKVGTGYSVDPANNSTGAGWDNALDLGAGGTRWKDLYLSGGVYLGGTGSANYLDDYEEGTWVPALNNGTVTTSNAYYRKVGNMVTVWAFLQSFSDGTSTSAVNITNLPFTASGTHAGGSVMGQYTDGTSTSTYVYAGTNLQFYSNSASGYNALTHNELNISFAEIFFVATYPTNT